MASAMSCRFLNGLFGPGAAPVPVWGAKENLASLVHALEIGLRIYNTTSTTGRSEASHAVEAVVGWLQRTRKAPLNLQEISGLSDEQREHYGFEPRTEAMDPAASVQDMGVPPFKDLDMAIVLASLRIVARYQELLTGSKLVFQVGVLTLTVQGTRQQFFAQTLMAEAGEATDTVWLYRWCTIDLNGQYEEHWRPFDAPMGDQPYPDVALPQRQIVLPNSTDHSVTVPNPPGTTQKPSTSQQPPKRRRVPKHKRWQYFEHQYLSDDELFAAPADLLQGPAILRLAHSYSNQDIFDRINTARPEGTGIRSVNVITKRLTHAIQAAAKASGRRVQEIRAEVTAAKYRNGVRHKGKVDVAPYV